jgi:hypothetical protein
MATRILKTLILTTALLACPTPSAPKTSEISRISVEAPVRRAVPAQDVDGCREEPAPRPRAPLAVEGCLDPEAAR